MSTVSSLSSKSGPVRRGKHAAPTRPAIRPRNGGPAVRLDGIDRDSRRLAAAILEVLAGVRTPVAAAQALDISLPKYYLMEARALQGLLAACTPRPKGRVRTAASELAAVRRECDRWQRACARQQTLARLAQRAVGLSPPSPPPKAAGSKKRRARRPTARALKVVERLREEETAAPAGLPGGNSDTGMSQ
jgi:hypothetical protein